MRWLIGIIIVAVLALGVTLILVLAPAYRTVTIGTAHIAAVVAETPQALTQGLGGTTSLPDGHGMLFVMPNPGLWGFWMKDMRYSLDIVWLDASKKVVYIVADVAPDTYPKVFTPAAPASYVVELPAGYAARHDVQVGRAASFNL